ncbi:unnamed protein product [Plutella xylostella]|uniref:(diamondback moth) hypothetical protein n=1 Tax=Plutella xylostella TaxID=51655 RepID=A0A8S4D0N7_PLUXY|nr:unnamed protein product [Plutella xylostella]
MKPSCIIITLMVILTMIVIVVMVKFATEISVEERRRDSVELSGDVRKIHKTMGLVAVKDDAALIKMAERFPYLAAFTRNSSTSWHFACFGALVVSSWVVTAARCRRLGATHRALLLPELTAPGNRTRTHPVLYWKLHDDYNATRPELYNIAVVKLYINQATRKSAVVQETKVNDLVQASIWKTLTTMTHEEYLTNDVDKYMCKLTDRSRCSDVSGVDLDDGVICVDMSGHEDCFVHEFGPIFFGNRIVGVLAVKPVSCAAKLAIFTNVSHYSHWILKTARD